MYLKKLSKLKTIIEIKDLNELRDNARNYFARLNCKMLGNFDFNARKSWWKAIKVAYLEETRPVSDENGTFTIRSYREALRIAFRVGIALLSRGPPRFTNGLAEATRICQ